MYVTSLGHRLTYINAIDNVLGIALLGASGLDWTAND